MANQKEKYTLETDNYDDAMEFLKEHQLLLEDAGFSISGLSFITFRSVDDEGEEVKLHEAYVEGSREYRKD